ncbi:ABC transporter substrate-binding protein [Dactylosporangium sucinum]|uniref:ABC transporter substrate-binding protein n=1 Tax=Dactylosporangium sucinum TaxID=1424081 RepID=A0A917TXH3_9ACTN|nr:ABC transporter substrate-binding protein [Dactylosporangium sucinum]GGM42871.1 ABC transporter substrate-binding protein [Dactylosporangium sucinum]
MADSPLLSRRSVLQLGGVGALLLATGACASGSKNNPSSSASGGAKSSTLKIAVSSYISSWDQDFVGFDLTALMLYKNVFPYMIDYGVKTVGGSRILDTENVMPTFAESFEPDAEKKVWTLKLRKGVKFPSGNELKAADVKWSKDRAFAAKANVAGIYRTIGLTKAEQVVVVDDYTVEFHQEFPSALTKQIQAISLYVFDSVEAKKHATDADPWAKEWFAKNPPTGGYFNVTKATQGQEIELTANDAYPGPDPAKTKTIRISVVPAAANQRLQLQAGDIDIALGASPRDIKDLKSAAGIAVLSAASNSQVAIQMSTTTAPFDDVNVRKALAYATPYEQIIKNVYGGDARPTKSVVPLDMPGYSEKGYPYTYDIDKAKAALAASGKPSITSELVFQTDNDEQQQIAVLVQSEARKAGIELKLTPLDPATLADRRGKKNIPLQITSGQLWVNDVEYMLATSFVQGANLNYANYTNPKIEQIYQQSHTTVDTGARNQLWAQVQEVMAEDVPWVVICQPNFNLPVRESVAGWVQPMDGLARLRYLGASA